MSSITGGRNASSSRSPGDADMVRSTPMRWVAAVVLSVLAVGLLGFLVALTYGLTSEYDFTAGNLQPFDVMVVLLMGCLALLLLLGARQCVGARRPPTAVLAVTVLTVFGGAGAASAVLGGAAHDRRTATVASACSAQDRELLAAVDFPGFRLGPLGDPNGGCVLHLAPQTDAATAIADLTANLERDGWQTVEPGGETATLERDGMVLTATTLSDGKATELVLTLR